MTSVVKVQASYTSSIARGVLNNIGARIGLAWITLLISVAVFAPFLATSYPLLIIDDEGWSSPACSLLTISDVVLICVFVTTFLLMFLKPSFVRSVITMLIVILVSGVLGSLFLQPPVITEWSKFRSSDSIENYDLVIRAPIPYSPKDYLRDFSDTGYETPLQDKQRIHCLGTEENGADVLSRMIHASRIALGIGFVATGIAMLLGVVIGGLMGFCSGIVDMLGMRLVEIFEAVPTLFLLLTFVAFFDRNLYLMMVMIGVTSWPGYARYIRAEFLRLREQDFVQAAIVCGLPVHSILFRHMLPNGIAPVLVAASFGVASAILAESTLSFLGLGLVDDPSWGQMLSQAVRSSTFYWWMALFPGGALFLTVFSYNLIGDALRDAIDPQLSDDPKI